MKEKQGRRNGEAEVEGWESGGWVVEGEEAEEEEEQGGEED